MKKISIHIFLTLFFFVSNISKGLGNHFYLNNSLYRSALEYSSRLYFNHCDSLISIIDGRNMIDFNYIAIDNSICLDSICFNKFTIHQTGSITKYSFIEIVTRSNSTFVDTIDIQIYLFNNNIFCIHNEYHATYHDFYDRYIIKGSQLLGISWGPSCRPFLYSQRDDFIKIDLPRYKKLIDLLYHK